MSSKDLKNDYDFNAQVKLITAKKEAEQIQRSMLNYRSSCIELMNKIIQQKNVKHTTTQNEFNKLFRDMTSLNRKLFILRKLVKEFRQARSKIISVKNKEPK
jgi:hypothetical protein